MHGGDGEGKLYFLLLKLIKRKKTQFWTKCLNSFYRRLWITVMDTFVTFFILFLPFLDFLYFDWESIYHGSRMPPGYYLEIHSERDIDSTVNMTAEGT